MTKVTRGHHRSLTGTAFHVTDTKLSLFEAPSSKRNKLMDKS
jgi:hypothetical protein